MLASDIIRHYSSSTIFLCLGNVGLGKTALLKQLNKRFDFDTALSYVYKQKITMKQVRIFVLAQLILVVG